MKRVLLLVSMVLMVTAIVAVAKDLLPQATIGLAVEPNGTPAPGLSVPSWACYQTCVLPSGVVVGDFYGNGWLDIAVSCRGTGQVWFYPNNRAPGVFGTPIPTPAGELPEAFSLIYDPAGSVHVISHPYTATGFNWSVSTVSPATITPPSPQVAPQIAELKRAIGGDLNHDTAQDIVTLDAAGQVNAHLAAGIGRLVVPVGAFGGTLPPIDGVIGDFNADGWNDVAVLGSGQLAIFYQLPFSSYGGGVPVFTVFNLPLPIVATAIDAGDFNADGLLDFVVVGTAGASFAAAYVNSPATPGAAFSLVGGQPMRTWGFDPRDVEVADFDGNGRDDFAVANYGSHTVTVYLSDAEGLEQDNRSTTERCLAATDVSLDHLRISFKLYKLEMQCGYYPIALDSGDLDWNGKIDLVVALESSDLEICPQNPSCIEVFFDPACGFHQSGNGEVPNQRQHATISGVSGKESRDCPDGCKDGGPCGDNEAPNAEIENSGNP